MHFVEPRRLVLSCRETSPFFSLSFSSSRHDYYDHLSRAPFPEWIGGSFEKKKEEEEGAGSKRALS